jgi:hypothetical protein
MAHATRAPCSPHGVFMVRLVVWMSEMMFAEQVRMALLSKRAK